MPLTKVTSGVIAANAVVDSFGTQSITGDKIGLTAINANNIVDGTITGVKISAGTITGDDLAANIIRANNIVAGQITGNLFAAGVVANATTATSFTANQTFVVANVTNQLQVYGATWQNMITLTDASTLTLNLAQTQNFTVTLGGSRTVANATNIQTGQSGMLVVRQDGTGGRTLTFGTGWRFPGNTAPTLTTTASAVDVIVFTARDSGNLVAQAILNVT